MAAGKPTTLEIAQSWFDYSSTSNIEGLKSLASPDATWWFSGLKEKVPVAGAWPYATRVDQLHGQFLAAMKNKEVKLKDILADGNTAVVELEVSGEGPAEGQKYANEAISKIKVVDGKIVEVKEYVDFLAILQYLEFGKTEGSS